MCNRKRISTFSLTIYKYARLKMCHYFVIHQLNLVMYISFMQDIYDNFGVKLPG